MKVSSTRKDMPSAFRLEQLFGSTTRARLLGLFLAHEEQPFFVRELTRRIGAQLNSVRREIKNLVDLGIVKEMEAKVAGLKKSAENKKYFQANTESILYPDLRALLSKVQILLKKNLVHEIDKQGKIDYLVLTGKFVQEKDLPVDLLIVGDMDQKVLAQAVRHFEAELGGEVNYTLMPREEFFYRRQISDRFLFSLLNANNIVMIDRLGSAR